ncbi:MAG: transposase family protein [Methylococcales bacterium]
MTDQPIASIIHHFSSIEDPRRDRNKKHLVSKIFIITLCATICEADNWLAIDKVWQS